MIILQDSQIKKIFHNGDEVKKILDWDGNVIFYKKSGGGDVPMTNDIKFHTTSAATSSNVFTVTYTDSTQDTVSYSEPRKEYTLSIPTDKVVTKIDFYNKMVDEVKVSCNVKLSDKFFTKKPKTIRIINCDATSTTDLYNLFDNSDNIIESIEMKNLDFSNVTDMRSMFRGCGRATTIDISNWNTSNVTNMSSTFALCSNVSTLDLSSWDTSNVTNMWLMFGNCSGITSLDLSSFNTSKVTDMRQMFQNCYSLQSLDLTNFNTSNVTNMFWMFYGCSGLTSLDLSSFDTSNVTNMSNMFSYCEKLTSLDVSHFNTSGVTSMNGMFKYCPKLASLDLSGWNTEKVTDMSNMFMLCQAKSLDLSGWDMTNVKSNDSMFFRCNSLTTVRMVGCNDKTVNKIKSALSSDGILSHVTIIT